ncbi:hypothetical protein [Gemmata massiliana]|uniref:hypothetical protein n=1 Tax=Gemmata massiliana TaxID=1210884 RepID=UPI0013A6E6BF|nr:hypothetical protein [Gemmata massiliana]
MVRPTTARLLPTVVTAATSADDSQLAAAARFRPNGPERDEMAFLLVTLGTAELK